MFLYGMEGWSLKEMNKLDKHTKKKKPPSYAVRQHLYRVYLQVQKWLFDINLFTEKWKTQLE